MKCCFVCLFCFSYVFVCLLLVFGLGVFCLFRLLLCLFFFVFFCFFCGYWFLNVFGEVYLFVYVLRLVFIVIFVVFGLTA